MRVAIFVRLSFQPTLPARGATLPFRLSVRKADAISTHAPRTGSDWTWSAATPPNRHFNPRSPHGERLVLHRILSA